MMAGLKRFISNCRDRYYRSALGLVDDPHEQEMTDVKTARYTLTAEIDRIVREERALRAARGPLK